MEVGREYESCVGTVNDEFYSKQVEVLRASGVTVRKIPASVRNDWANTLKDWPQQKATELDKPGMPATQILKLWLDAQEKAGHKWPVRDVIQ